MFLDYLALALLVLSLTVVFYTFIYIHDLPHKVARERDHPHEEAIHPPAAGAALEQRLRELEAK